MQRRTIRPTACENCAKFLQNPSRYFEGSYERFKMFGGPCVYFHEQCLRAGADAFLSKRHVEMLYATLTSWGMHRMGAEKITTKLVPWDEFSESLLKQKAIFEPLLGRRMIDLPDAEYCQAIDDLEPAYSGMEVSVSASSIVANSKALFHVLPELVPPIDRRYTWRFFHVVAPKQECQFSAFRDICCQIKKLADRVGCDLIEGERRMHGVYPPKAIDNAIVNFVSLN